MIVFDASAVVSTALREDSVPERALLHAEAADLFALSAEVDAEIAEVLGRPRFAGPSRPLAGHVFWTSYAVAPCGSARPSA